MIRRIRRIFENMNSVDAKLTWADAVIYLQKQHGVRMNETLLRSRHKHGSGPAVLKPNARSILFPQSALDAWVQSWGITDPAEITAEQPHSA